MITDNIANAARYRLLGPRTAHALEFLQAPGLDSLADGRHDLEGDELYALVQRYDTKLPDQGRWEAHRRYADLQFVVSGTERFGHGAMGRFEAGPYDDKKDVLFLTGSGDFVTLQSGDFILVWPGEVHMPQMAAGASAPVKKIVIKIAVG